MTVYRACAKFIVAEVGRFNFALILVFILGGIVYVGNSLSPSSYASALNLFQVKDNGLIFGLPRAVRSDEWAALTPLTQASINNHFTRYNETSFYREDLRTFFSLPIFDWGMIFKPTMWLYPLINPAYAYSFHNYALIFLFIFGYTQLFRMVGGKPAESLLIALALFFTGFTQFWWTVLGPVLAFFPWIMVALDSDFRPWLKLLVFYWLATSWLQSLFYPPIIISLAFVAFLIILAFRSNFLHLKFLLGIALATVASIATVGFYLKDLLLKTSLTIYPGQRSGLMGGSVPFEEWISQLLPTSQMHHFDSLIAQNISEIGTVGSYYTLLVLCFLDYSKCRRSGIHFPYWKPLVLLVIGLLMMTAWMLLPLPAWVAAPLLWDRMQPERMEYAAGQMLLLVAFISARFFGLNITRTRFLVFSSIILAGWYYYKALRGYSNVLESWYDVVIIPAIALTIYLLKRSPLISTNTAFLSVSALMGMVSFGTFNPLQSAWPIFNRSETPVTKILDNMVAEQNGILAITGFPGAILNGWGYPSVSHINATPHLDLWKKTFPLLEPAELDHIFNRFAHIILTEENEPRLIHGSAIGVPLRAFTSIEMASRSIKITGFTDALPSEVGGHIDRVESNGQKMRITGWAPWHGLSSSQTLYLLSSQPISDAKISNIQRLDVAAHMGSSSYLRSGFDLELTLAEPAKNDPRPLFCLIAADTATGQKVVLYNPGNPNACSEIAQPSQMSRAAAPSKKRGSTTESVMGSVFMRLSGADGVRPWPSAL